ncbi:MAG: hypothetical protein ACRC14_01250 [Paracoccaceae bacterium]
MLDFLGYMTRVPYPEACVSGDLNALQLETADDFAAYRAMAQADWPPILVSFSQKYQILDRVLGAIETHLDADYDVLLMTLRVPGAMRFPRRFYSDRVFLVASPEREAQRLHSAAKRVLILHEGLVRHPMETGRNELSMRLLNPAADAGARFDACCREFEAIGFDAPLPVLLARAG